MSGTMAGTMSGTMSGPLRSPLSSPQTRTGLETRPGLEARARMESSAVAKPQTLYQSTLIRAAQQAMAAKAVQTRYMAKCATFERRFDARSYLPWLVGLLRGLDLTNLDILYNCLTYDELAPVTEEGEELGQEATEILTYLGQKSGAEHQALKTLLQQSAWARTLDIAHELAQDRK